MSIEVGNLDYVGAYIADSNANIQVAIQAINSAKTMFMLADDKASAHKCSEIVSGLKIHQSTLNNVSREFEKTKNTLLSIDKERIAPNIDKNNTTANNSDSVRNIGLGVGVGALASLVGNAAASSSLNALKTAIYRKSASQLHGFAFEVMFANKLNNGLGHRLFTKAIVDGSNTPGSDVIVTRFGKVLERYELKATSSKAYAKKALSNSAYKDSTLIFTSEMAEEVGGKSGKYTLAATKKTASVAKSSSKAALAVKSIAKSAAASGVVGAVVDGGIEAVSKFSDWKSGEISSKEYLSGIGKEVAIGGVAGAITGAVLTGAAVAGVTLTGGLALVAGATIGGLVSWGLHKLFK